MKTEKYIISSKGFLKLVNYLNGVTGLDSKVEGFIRYFNGENGTIRILRNNGTAKVIYPENIEFHKDKETNQRIKEGVKSWLNEHSIKN